MNLILGLALFLFIRPKVTFELPFIPFNYFRITILITINLSIINDIFRKSHHIFPMQKKGSYKRGTMRIVLLLRWYNNDIHPILKVDTVQLLFTYLIQNEKKIIICSHWTLREARLRCPEQGHVGANSWWVSSVWLKPIKATNKEQFLLFCFNFNLKKLQSTWKIDVMDITVNKWPTQSSSRVFL